MSKFLVRLILELLASLPLRVLHAVGRLIGKIIYRLPGKYRDRFRANAAQAGYTDEAFLVRAAGESGAMFMELPRVWLRNEACLKLAHNIDEPMMQEVMAENRGILFLQPHLGGFELAARHRAKTLNLTVMFRPPRKAFLLPIVEMVRNRSGIHTVPANLKGVRSFYRILREKRAVGMLPDQVPSRGDGVWAPFFGKMAYTVSLPGKLAEASNAVMLVVGCKRLPKGKGWEIFMERVPEPLPESQEDQAALVNQIMESMIRRFPEQYMWGYNRFKLPKGVAPPPEQHGNASQPQDAVPST